MHQLSINLGTINYNLIFVNGKAAAAANESLWAAKKDDPQGQIKIEDDFAQVAIFVPAQVAASIVIDKERESEIMIQNKLQEIKTNIMLNQRIAGDASIQMAAKQAALLTPNQPPGQA